MSFFVFCQRLDMGHRYQRAAVDPNKSSFKFVLQFFDRLVNEQFAVVIADRYVFLVGMKINHIPNRDQAQLPANTRADVLARFVLFARYKTGQLWPGQPARASQSVQQALPPDRFGK